MLIILALVVLTVGGYAITEFAPYNSGWESAGGLFLIMGGLLLFFALLFLPLMHLGGRGEIQSFQSVRETIGAARTEERGFENAAIQLKVVETNQWLAGAQYWNDSPFGLWIPDAVEDLEPIR